MQFELPRVVDSTMMGAFRACEQRFAWSHGFGLALRSAGRSADLVAGGAFAAGREAAYRVLYSNTPASTMHNAVAAAREAFTAEWGDFTIPPEVRSFKTFERTWKCLMSYLDEYSPPRDTVTPHFSLPGGASPFEWSFAVPLTEETTGMKDWPEHPVSGDPFIYGGRLDEVALLSHNGATAVLDDKTTAAFKGTWAKGLALRAQFIGYTWSIRKLVDPLCSTVIARQTAIRAGDDNKSHGDAARHREVILEVPDYMITKWLETTRETLHAVTRAWTRGTWRADLGDACTAWNRLCEFAPLCMSAAPQQRAEEDYETRRWNPLERGALITATD